MQLGLRVVDVARMVGCKPNKLARFENTGRLLADEQLDRLADVLGISTLTMQDLLIDDCFEKLALLKEQRERRRKQQEQGETPYPIHTHLTVYRDEES